MQITFGIYICLTSSLPLISGTCFGILSCTVKHSRCKQNVLLCENNDLTVNDTNIARNYRKWSISINFIIWSMNETLFNKLSRFLLETYVDRLTSESLTEEWLCKKMLSVNAIYKTYLFNGSEYSSSVTLLYRQRRTKCRRQSMHQRFIMLAAISVVLTLSSIQSYGMYTKVFSYILIWENKKNNILILFQPVTSKRLWFQFWLQQWWKYQF